jgi:hypothetical protein
MACSLCLAAPPVPRATSVIQQEGAHDLHHPLQSERLTFANRQITSLQR